MLKIERIGLRVNKGERVFVRVQDATVELGIKGGKIASTLTTNEPNLSHHHSNMVLEGEEMKIMNNIKNGCIECPVGSCFDTSFPNSTARQGGVQNNGDIVSALTSASSENIYAIETQYRIRKLTPKEYWRLMGYIDKDFNNASKVVSSTQLYKQAGNAIVKQVLMAIFLQMGIQGKKKWNDMTEEERQEMINGSIK